MYNFVHPYIPLSVHFYFIINIMPTESINFIEKQNLPGTLLSYGMG